MPSPVLTQSELHKLWENYADYGVMLHGDGSVTDRMTPATHGSTLARIKAGAVAGDELAQRWIALRITNRMSK